MKIALLAMPFQFPAAPSLALTQIKGRINEVFHRDVEVRLFYINLDFYCCWGHENYMKVMADSTYTLANEWLFRQEAFDNIKNNRDEYYSRFYQRTMAQVWGAEYTDKIMKLGAFIDDSIKKYRLDAYDLVGINATFSLTPGLAFCRHLKQAKKDIITVMGGASLYKEMGEALIRYYPYVDYVCSGSGLAAFPGLIRGIMKKDETACQSIAGMLTKNNVGKVEPLAEELDINVDIPLDYDDFLEKFNALDAGEFARPAILLETSRGCYWRKCKFCGLNEDQLKYRVKRTDKAIEEINGYLEKYNADIEMVDNVMPRNYIRKVLPYLKVPKDRNIMYEVRADYSDEEMEILRQAGVKQIQPGIESLVTGILDEMNKGVTALQCIRMLKSCLKYEIKPGWNIIVGFPDITDEMYEKLIKTIPMVVHFFPPTVLTPVRFDRYSIYWLGKYDLDLSPFAAYEYIYPYDKSFLSGIAYYFEDKNYHSRRYRLIGEYYPQVEKWVNYWKKRWQSGSGGDPENGVPKLYRSIKEGSPYIYDSRGESVKNYPISDMEERILNILEHPLVIDDIKNSLEGENLRYILKTLYRLEGKDLIFKEGRQYLSLVM